MAEKIKSESFNKIILEIEGKDIAFSPLALKEITKEGLNPKDFAHLCTTQCKKQRTVH